ncbi:Uncharacterised protein [Mycobacteroides abscessus]|nr:Uncharacterised protein [Mycobacteroides abscessus]
MSRSGTTPPASCDTCDTTETTADPGAGTPAGG